MYCHTINSYTTTTYRYLYNKYDYNPTRGQLLQHVDRKHKLKHVLMFEGNATRIVEIPVNYTIMPPVSQEYLRIAFNTHVLSGVRVT